MFQLGYLGVIVTEKIKKKCRKAGEIPLILDDKRMLVLADLPSKRIYQSIEGIGNGEYPHDFLMEIRDHG